MKTVLIIKTLPKMSSQPKLTPKRATAIIVADKGSKASNKLATVGRIYFRLSRKNKKANKVPKKTTKLNLLILAIVHGIRIDQKGWTILNKRPPRSMDQVFTVIELYLVSNLAGINVFVAEVTPDSNPQSKALTEMTSVAGLPCVTNKNEPAMARKMAMPSERVGHC